MSKLKDAMIHYCELAVCRIDGQTRRDVEFEATMNRLLGMDAAEMIGFGNFLKSMRIVERIKATTGERRLRWATKLWNAIDCMDIPEPLWNLMYRELPDAHYPGTRCLRFTY